MLNIDMKNKSTVKYRSKVEAQVHKDIPMADYEPWSMGYSIQHKYTPDFVIGPLVFEVKGYFRPGDTQKYKAINQALKEEGKEFIFLFQKPSTKVRKNSKITLEQWALKNKILSFGVKEVKGLFGKADWSDIDSEDIEDFIVGKKKLWD